ncbi:unnamed protein product [Heligmosomoides polygyrus]|uniref:C2H2-type domain-containing protein n=1 Tax=Heligmosomoides polygyrus TaxID=6339 RepID=A0A3P8B0Z6_HELPZ|nr:unnamed protein product [Heligmosomoides polygyrus]
MTSDLKRPDLKLEFFCGHCGKTFCHAASLNRHRLNFHGDDQHCQLCDAVIPVSFYAVCFIVILQKDFWLVAAFIRSSQMCTAGESSHKPLRITHLVHPLHHCCSPASPMSSLSRSIVTRGLCAQAKGYEGTYFWDQRSKRHPVVYISFSC